MSHKKSRKHQFGRGSGSGVNLGLIITPMLDMSFQLLAFFVMTYHPPVNVGFVEGALLPPSREKEAAKPPPKEKKNVDIKPSKDDKKPEKKEDKKEDKKEEKKVEDTEPELKSDLLLVIVHTVKEGQKEDNRVDGDPSTVEIRRPEAIAPMIISMGANLSKKEFVSGLRKKLDAELTKILNEPGNLALKKDNKPLEVKLEVDGRLKHGYWMNFYDTCKLAGFQNIHFVAPAPDAQIQPR